MDLLDSILNGMEKPPSIKKLGTNDKEKNEKLEKAQKDREAAANKRKATFDKFRADMTKRIKDFVNTPTTEDPKTFKLVFKPMFKVYRSMLREISEEFEDEIVVYSFGTEDIDRHCIIWRKGFEPCDEELTAMKLGVEYKPKRKEHDEEPSDEEHDASSSKTTEGKDKFWGKYEKIIGQNASGLESAKATVPAKQYGCVPIENKKDQRSIEQMMDDIRKSKKQKTSEESR